MSQEGKGQFAEILSGIGIGSLIGLLIGLSIQSVAGTVLAALVALLAAFLGLTHKFSTSASKGTGEGETTSTGRSARIAAFGIACTVAVLCGVFIRTHDWLTPPIRQQVEQWKSAGFSDDVSRSLVIYKQTGVLPQGMSAGKPRIPQNASVLFAITPDDCRLFDRSAYSSLGEQLNSLRLRQGRFADFAEALSRVPAGNQESLLAATRKLVCE
ncbi:MAG: hypothetical protein ACRD2O_13355 [Terriglobia bacterium]